MNTPAKEGSTEESKEELLKKAPVVPYFPGLFYWGKDEIELGDGVEREHRFLGTSSAPTIDAKSVRDLTMRKTVYKNNSGFNPAAVNLIS